MTKSIHQIKQELNDLESTVAEIAVEFQNQYRNYLDLLGQSLKQQLVLASYQICTQFYPQAFIDLSLSNKQDLQQTLRQIGKEIQPSLLEIIEQQELEPEPQELNLMAELIKNLPNTKRKSKTSEETKTEAELSELDLEAVKAELANLENIELIEIDTVEDDGLSESFSEAPLSVKKTPDKQPIKFNNPEHLLLWYKQIERNIKQQLDNTSKQVNQCLQSHQIIPERIPSKIIDVALQTDGSKGTKNNRKVQNVPNIIHLTIETERGKKPHSPQSTAQLSLLRLRLAEIEFADPMLNAQRGQLRTLMGQISQLKNKYKVIQHQFAVAQAQAAWRSSWYEE